MGRAWWLVVVLCAACANTTSNFCSDGTVCPGGFTCDVDNHRCLLPEQTAACDGKQEGDDCTVAMMPGACRSGACETFYCGDGYVTEGEDCDGDNLAGADCKAFGYYGADGLRCSDSCTYDQTVCRQQNEYCGDGTVNGPELCDGPEVRTCVALGFDAGTASCDLQCSFTILDCSRFGWNPESLSDVLALAVAGSSKSDQWAVGENGRAMHFEGLYWVTVPTGVPNTLIRAWSNAPDDVWAIGQPTASLPAVVIHWNGQAWSPVTGVPTGEYIDIWGTDAQHMYIATTTGVIAFNGSTWTNLGTVSGTPWALRGTSANDIWLATAQGPLLHWKGTSWVSTDSPPGANIQALDANAPDDVWAIGYATSDQGTSVVAHWTGAAWQQWVTPQRIENVVASSAPNDAWVGGVDGIMRHWDGVAWSSSTNIGASPSGLTALSGLISFGPEDVVGVSTLNLAYRYRGQTFGILPPLGPNPFDATPNTAMWGPEDNLYVTNRNGEVWRFDGTTWTLATTVPQPSMASNSANDVWGTSATDIYVAADDGNVYHYDGNTWTPDHVAGTPLTRVWGTGPGDVWAFSMGLAYHKTGATWTSYTLGNSPLSVSGTGPSDIWAVEAGTPNQLWHWDGNAWTPVATGATTSMLAVAAVAPDDVHVSATQGRMLHFNGSAWSEVIVPTLADITFMSFTAADDVVAASARDLLHYNGEAWSNMRTPIDFVPNTADYIPIVGLQLHPDRIDILLDRYRIRTLLRTRPLKCRATETCGDGVDNDCDNKLDSVDPDCP